MTNSKPKTQYTITAAHRVTGKSRTTIQKHIKKGKISYTEGPGSTKLIDASELLRAYGDACDFSKEEGGDANQSDRQEPLRSGEPSDVSQRLLEAMREERERERSLYQSQVEQLQGQLENLQEALRLAQEGQNRATLLLQDRSQESAWAQSISELEQRVANQEKALQDDWRSLPWWRLLLR